MSIVTMYGIRNCDTVQKARAWLDQRGVDYGFHDSESALALMLAQPSMIKRPVLELAGRLVVGFGPELYQSLRW